MQKITLTVDGIEVSKKGTKKGGEPWTLSKVKGSDGRKYSTFLEGLRVGQSYDFLILNEPWKDRDGRTHDGWKITGFDNASYEKKGVAPLKPAPGKTQDGFTSEDRRMLQAIYDTVLGK